MIAFLPECNPRSNFIDAMWFQSWQSGYEDIIKRGFPRPTDNRTILAELRTPQVDDFLHEGAADVPFLVSARARKALEYGALTGFDFGPVVVAKIASKGKRTRAQTTGEPEDRILKARGISVDAAPTLHAVWVTGFMDIVPDYESGRTPSGTISPFRPDFTAQTPDLWRPRYRGVPFGGYTFCSDRFRLVCQDQQLSNIKFQEFEPFMNGIRKELKRRGRG